MNRSSLAVMALALAVACSACSSVADPAMAPSAESSAREGTEFGTEGVSANLAPSPFDRGELPSQLPGPPQDSESPGSGHDAASLLWVAAPTQDSGTLYRIRVEEGDWVSALGELDTEAGELPAVRREDVGSIASITVRGADLLITSRDRTGTLVLDAESLEARAVLSWGPADEVDLSRAPRLPSGSVDIGDLHITALAAETASLIVQDTVAGTSEILELDAPADNDARLCTTDAGLIVELAPRVLLVDPSEGFAVVAAWDPPVGSGRSVCGPGKVWVAPFDSGPIYGLAAAGLQDPAVETEVDSPVRGMTSIPDGFVAATSGGEVVWCQQGSCTSNSLAHEFGSMAVDLENGRLFISVPREAAIAVIDLTTHDLLGYVAMPAGGVLLDSACACRF